MRPARVDLSVDQAGSSSSSDRAAIITGSAHLSGEQEFRSWDGASTRSPRRRQKNALTCHRFTASTMRFGHFAPSVGNSKQRLVAAFAQVTALLASPPTITQDQSPY